MGNIKSNERELSGKVAGWLNEHIKRNNYPFSSVSIETGIGTSGTTKFGDIIFWKDRSSNDSSGNEKLKYLLNSTLFFLFLESNTRVNLGDGLLDVAVYEMEGTSVPKSNLFEKEELKEIKKLFNKIAKRNIKSIHQEVKMKDRKAFDSAILKALGLDPDEYLPRIYEGLCQMVKERLELPKMRKKQKQQAQDYAHDQVKASVIRDCLPNGVKQFPEGFFNPATKNGDQITSFSDLDFDEYTHTGKPLIIKEFFGEYEVEDTGGTKIFQADSKAQAEYAQILSKPKRYQLKIPKQDAYAGDMVSCYREYVKELYENLEANAQTKLHDWSKAEKMAEEILKEYGLKYE